MSVAVPVIGLDDGYSGFKAICGAAQANIPTSISTKRRVSTSAALATNIGPEEHHYKVNDVVYAVGEKVEDPIDPRFDAFPFSEANLALAIHAIQKVAPGFEEVDVVAGLPLNRYYTKDGSVRDGVCQERADAWRSRKVTLPNGQPGPRIRNVIVVAEAVAAWLDYVMDDLGNLSQQRAAELTAVVDIGGRTTDIALIENGKVRMDYSGTIDYGALHLNEAISEHIEDQAGINNISRHIIDEAIKTGFAKIGNKTIPVNTVLNEKRVELIERIKSFTLRKLDKQAKLVNRFLLVGGGVHALGAEIAKQFPDVTVPNNPEFANARGMYKYGKLTLKNRTVA